MRVLAFLFLSISILSARDTLPEESVKALQSLLSDSKEYQLFPMELFDGDMPWRIDRNTSYLQSLKFINKTSDSEAYKTESGLYYNEKSRGLTKNPLRALQVHSNIEIPGRDRVYIKPQVPRSLPAGEPILVCIWVYSNNYDSNLKLVLQETGKREFAIDLGSLRFKGWKRIEKQIPKNPKPERLNLFKFSRYELSGLLIETSRHQNKESISVYFDQMGILMEKPASYPGSEIPDGWYIE